MKAPSKEDSLWRTLVAAYSRLGRARTVEEMISFRKCRLDVGVKVILTPPCILRMENHSWDNYTGRCENGFNVQS